MPSDAFIIPQGVLRNDDFLITATVTMEENYSDTLALTEQPVEIGAMITDHSYKRPAEVMLQCGWSNSDAAAQSDLSQPSISGGGGSTSDYATTIYMQLLALQESRNPFALQTSIRLYNTMLITSLALTRDATNAQALFCTLTCREVILVSTATATLPPATSQAQPANTAETQQTGSVLLQGASAPGSLYPAPGGSLPPSAWNPFTPDLTP